MKRFKILMIDESENTRRFLQAMLSREFDLIGAENGVQGVEAARTQNPDLIILDVVLPILSGFDACSLLKKDPRTKQIPIIFLSSKNTPAAATQGLSVGADDFIPKPFDYTELLARIKIRLFRPEQERLPQLIIGDLTIDPTAREVFYQGKKTHLTLTEFDILRLLTEKKGDVVSREEILKTVWKDESHSTNDRTIDVHIRALRKKMPTLSKSILSIYGVGYKFDPDPSLRN